MWSGGTNFWGEIVNCIDDGGTLDPNPTANLVGCERRIGLAFVLRVVLVCFLLMGTGAVAQAEAIQRGDQGAEVEVIQRQLQGLGLLNGRADGDFGSGTERAVKAFQKERGLEPDGIVGEETYRSLVGREMPVSRDGSATTVRRIIQTAMRYEGTPYAYGGSGPGGFDCSGFVRFVYAQAGISLPRMADEQFEVGRPVSYSNLRVGDLVFFTTYAAGASHVGVYMGNGQFIHASTSYGVRVDYLTAGYWGDRYIGARRLQ